MGLDRSRSAMTSAGLRQYASCIAPLPLWKLPQLVLIAIGKYMSQVVFNHILGLGSNSDSASR